MADDLSGDEVFRIKLGRGEQMGGSIVTDAGLAYLNAKANEGRTPSCGDADYQRCPECQASKSEPHLAGCPVLGQGICHWCREPAYGHDVTACMEKHR